MLRILYDRVILPFPKTVLLIMFMLVGILGLQARNLEIDASAETLILEDDKDLQFTRLINERYGSSDFLIISYSPTDDLLSDKTLKDIGDLRDKLTTLEGIESVTTILDVPLLESPPRPIKELVSDVPTLQSPTIDKKLARRELLTSPIYRNLLVSPDLRTTALQINLPDDPIYKKLLERRNELRQKQNTQGLEEAEEKELNTVQERFKIHRDLVRERQHRNIIDIRTVMKEHQGSAELFLGGVSMIADDLITFIKNDLKIFGLGVSFLLAMILWLIFRERRWVILPLLCSVISVVVTCGLLGAFGWEVTVITSNFISLQLIITMAIVIHLIVRYREFICHEPTKSQHELVLETVLAMARPCSFAVLTTVAGFSSLILCDILPVINFGWMMSAGIGVSLILTFMIFPPLLMILPKKVPSSCYIQSSFTKNLADFTEKRGRFIFAISLLLVGVSILGCSRLAVENSFIGYFRETTEIYQGMKVIDEELGGTTPLEVVIDFPRERISAETEQTYKVDDIFGELDAEFEAEKNESQYWFTADKMSQVESAHDYLDSLPETGKVLSLATLLKVGRRLNQDKDLDNFKLALIYNELPENYRKIVLSPYVSIENSQTRFSLRVRDSDKNLRRNKLLKKIRHDMTEKLGFEDSRVHLAGILVLYNNMLQSLFSSQILTLGAVIVVLLLMFLVLFRSIKVSLIAISPNLLSVGTILGFMGWAGIPLDMMTITIAAISVGIAVDDTIHYIHRFKNEFSKDQNYVASMHRSHGSTGFAMYYTSVTIIIGFSILVVSNFIPSIYFGLLTGLAMAIALIAALTLLPYLIVLVRPFGPEGGHKNIS